MKKIILLFYKYVHIKNPHDVRLWQHELSASLGLVGRILLAHEGINGTLAGTCDATQQYIAAMNKHPLFGGIDFKASEESGEHNYFSKLSVKVKSEIVHFGKKAQGISPDNGGVHLTPEQTHDLIRSKDKDLLILDGRNYYEARVGTFENAVTPQIDHFRDFPDYVDNNQELFKDKKVLMFCTGGVRCERASAYLKSKEVAQEVYQIAGGIHRYVEKFPDGFFRGKNYVFDDRVTVPVTNDILSSCDHCSVSCDDFTNCSSTLCNKQFIACVDCLEKFNHACCYPCFENVTYHNVKKRIYKQKAPAERVKKKDNVSF